MNFMNNNYDSKTNKYNKEYQSKLAELKTSSSATSNSTQGTSGKTDSSNLNVLLQKGGNFKGTITDIRQNEVSIKLEDGSNLTAKISNPSSLQIGENAEFKVVYQSEQIIGIEVVTNTQSNQELVISKALEGANLPVNEKNQSIVHALLDHNMSIDKQTLQNILRYSYKHPDVSVDTLVLMNKYKIPINEANITQFEQYKNLEHRIMNGVSTISNELSYYIDELLNHATSSKVNMFHSELLDLLLDSKSSNVDSSIKVPIIPPIPSSYPSQTSIMNIENILSSMGNSIGTLDQIDIMFSSSANYLNSGSLTTQMLSNEEKYLLQELLGPNTASKNEQTSLLDGTLDINHVLSILDESFTQNNMEIQPLNQDHINLLYKMIENVKLHARENNYLSTYMSNAERLQLLEDLSHLPLPEEFQRAILDGSIRGETFLETIQPILTTDPNINSDTILDSKGYQNILKEVLESKWTLTPKLLSEDGNVEQLYKTLEADLDKMRSILEHTPSIKENLSNNTLNLKENIDFMKTINEMFTYVQLPVKFRNQKLHSDLYIYTNKKDLKEKKENISVLLHLDMEHLGPTDIHLTLTNISIAAKFYITSEDSKELFEQNIPLLETALNKKGYSLISDITIREKETNIVTELLEQQVPSSSIKRYSFDIRT